MAVRNDALTEQLEGEKADRLEKTFGAAAVRGKKLGPAGASFVPRSTNGEAEKFDFGPSRLP
jgi:hypothetical protein